MKRAFTSAFIILLLATVSLAAPTTVYGPQKVQATPNSTTLNTIITNNLNNADGVLTIINGNGEDLSLKSCSKRSIFEFLACELENVAKRTFAIFDRPTLIEVSLNNRVIASSSQIPASMGKFQTSVKINLVNQLQIKVKGLWTASATFEIKAETQAPNQNPIAQLTTTPINGTAPLLVSFSGLASSDPDGDFISQYKWEFGDGGVATGPTPTHIFANPGTFSVKLTVVDNRGGQGSIIQPLTVQQNQAPSASFLATIGTVENELSVHFDASESQDLDGQITSFHFDFGDGATADTPIANHTYLQPGIYQVTLKVQDDKGTSSTLTKSIELRDTIAPILTLQSPTEGALMAGKTFVVTGASSERLSEARIQFNGDTTVYNLPLNSEQNGFSQSITLSQDGNRTLSITAKDLSGNQTSLTRQFVLDATSPNLTFVNPTSGTTKYTNALPYALTLEVSSSERLSQEAVNGQPLTIINNDTAATGLLSLATAGISNLVVTAKDIAGNESSLTETFEVIFDNRAPVVALDIQDKTRTALFQIPLSVSIDDSSPAYTEIKVNGEQTLTTGAKQFTALVYLNQEGENNIEVSSKDEAGNSSAISKIAVIRDSAGPVLSSIMPADNSNIQSVGFQVSASSNEELKSVTVNGLPAVLSTDKKSFSFTLVAQSQGPLQIRILAEDLLGNYSNYTVNVQIQSKVLIAELVSVVPAEDGQHLIVNGAIGASRPGAQIKAVTGLFTFNNGETNSNSDGSFQIKLDPFMSVTVTGKDLSTGEQDSTVINYGSQTRISGIVKSVDDVPLMGATVGIVGSTKTVHTDGNGAFALTGIPSGDQMLYIDGATIVIQSNDRKYSKTNVAVNIGLGQQNVMERPIYLAPLMLDGTQTPVLANSTTIVTSPNAPGVSLNIPANSASFPTGGATGNINISSVSADKSTVPVPESAVPTSVVTLEPSGLSFSQKVELTLPNDNELPAGVEMIILSMNSKKGQWEVDGLAKVSEDGNRIVTKPGYGISHFSLVYAVPIKPVIMEMSDKKIAGIDASRGSLSTGFQLPSFKSLGTTVTPSFVYKSAWANPTAVVTNWFDIPSGKVTATYSGSQQANSIQVISQTYCYGPFNTFCETDYQRYYINLKRQTDTKTTSWYQPESIKSQFFVSSLTSDSAVLSGNASVGTDPSGQQLLPGPNIKIGSASKIYEYKGIPNQSTIGYAVD